VSFDSVLKRCSPCAFHHGASTLLDFIRMPCPSQSSGKTTFLICTELTRLFFAESFAPAVFKAEFSGFLCRQNRRIRILLSQVDGGVCKSRRTRRRFEYMCQEDLHLRVISAPLRRPASIASGRLLGKSPRQRVAKKFHILSIGNIVS